MKRATIVIGSFMLFISAAVAPAAKAAPVNASQTVLSRKGIMEFRVGSPTSTVIAGARVIVISHEGKILDSGLTNARGTWETSMPLIPMEWNKGFSAKGIVNAVVIANGYNEQAVFVIPITQHTVQPVTLQPILPKGRNEPSASLGNFSRHDVGMYVNRYANEMKLKRQPPIPGEPGFSPWSPNQR